MVKTNTCINEVVLNDYLNGKVSRESRERIEQHLAGCGECMDALVFAYQTVDEYKKIKACLPAGREKKMKANWKKHIWLIGTIIAFALSFFKTGYFAQFLVAAILMGAKWIFDTTNARMLIMIYDAWQKGGEKEASRILRNFKTR
ncbi:MAG: zf-HC2 domain-containing protein [Candidatus Omnitrophica bacterium]|nr:zf-HC2 domain-containing protein [Candidatus Omnitrophota bacterium]